MPHFFISYAKKDTRELALALSDALNTLPNVTAWVDKSLSAGQSWELQIQKEIDRCDFIIVLYSPDINRHQHGEEESYVLTEISYAKYTLKKPIIPIMAQKTTPPLALTTSHYIDFTLSGLTIDDLIVELLEETYLKPIPPKPPASRRSTSLDLLPAPFEWIDIPAGRATLITERFWAQNYIPEGKPQTFFVEAFQIAKYPITNAQFELFIQAGGYDQKKWWTSDGWEAKTANDWTQPHLWNDELWNQPDQPVVAVSWYESVAFCLWLSETVGENIRLLTEQEWQHAAQGDTHWNYPYSSKFDHTRCNFNTTRTTAVTQYPNGASPYGVMDMSGNVWEWCSTIYKTGQTDLIGTDARLLHGGSWRSDNQGSLRVTARERFRPNEWTDEWGFRLARSH